MKITLSKALHEELRTIVFATKKETGACLFGIKDGEDFKILHIAGPGPRAKKLRWHYEGDNAHYENVYNALLKIEPELLHLGEFHVHPVGMPELSCGDLHTIKKVLKEYEEFVAGVILRSPNGLSIFPVYFSRSKEENLELVIE